MARRQNIGLGMIQFSPAYTVATVPAASKYLQAVIFVSNGAAGAPILAFSNGTNWMRVDTNTAISAV